MRRQLMERARVRRELGGELGNMVTYRVRLDLKKKRSIWAKKSCRDALRAAAMRARSAGRTVAMPVRLAKAA